MSDFMDRNAKISKHGGKLPHWQQVGKMQFVTIRLADAMPMAKLRLWKEERDNWLHHHPKPWDAKVEKEYHRRFSAKLEDWLDAGSGSCIFREKPNREILESVMMKFQGKRVIHEARVIMPNHAHLLFTPLVPLEQLMQSWKGVSARLIGLGSVWQENFRDTMIRDQKHFRSAVKYIRRNPAKLMQGTFSLWESERAKEVEQGHSCP